MNFFTLSRAYKIFIVGCIDIAGCVGAVFVAMFLRTGNFNFSFEGATLAAFVALVISVPIFVFFGLYKPIFRFGGYDSLVPVFKSFAYSSPVFAGILVFIGVDGVPRTVGVLQPLIFFCYVISVRLMIPRLIELISERDTLNDHKSICVIYGAGATGRRLLGILRKDRSVRVVGFIDDNLGLKGFLIDGITIYSFDDIDYLRRSEQVEFVVMGIPSMSEHRLATFVRRCNKKGITVRSLPPVNQLIQGKFRDRVISDVDVDELLGREAVVSDGSLLQNLPEGKCILVTGAGGSIGGELVRSLASLKPKTLILFDASEFALYSISEQVDELLHEHQLQDHVEVVSILGSVVDATRVRSIFEKFGPELVFHAAAYKHVPLVENNICEGIKNNIFGTDVVARLSLEFGVLNFVLVSTDKAVRPTSVMGASKRIAEKLLRDLAEAGVEQESRTIFCTVRFGNVLDSSGSVIPLFRRQIERGGPVTITDPRITRYFMTIPEAASLVIQAAALSDSGDVFVLEMGKPIKILELACRMIEQAGYRPRLPGDANGDIPIIFTGLRHGEKMYEELFEDEALVEPTIHPKLRRLKEPVVNGGDLTNCLRKLRNAIELGDENSARKFLFHGVD